MSKESDEADLAEFAHELPPRKRERWTMYVPMAVFAVLALLAIASVVDSSRKKDAPDQATATVQNVDPAVWPKDYASTSCAEWTSAMTSEQQTTVAADMLTAARNKGDAGAGVAPSSLVGLFRTEMTQNCVMPGLDTNNIAEVAAALYLVEHDKFRP